MAFRLIHRLHLRGIVLRLAVMGAGSLVPAVASEIGQKNEDISVMSASETSPPPFVVKFLERAAVNTGSEEMDPKAVEYGSQLPPSEQVELARWAVRQSEPRIKNYGLGRLVDLGKGEEAVPYFADLVTKGDDLTRYSWSWLHSDRSELMGEMFMKICRYLLDHYDSYRPEERAKAEVFISPAPRKNGPARFSKIDADRRLREFEREFEVRKRSAEPERLKE